MSKHTPGPWQTNHCNETQVCDCDGGKRGCGPIAYMAGTADEKRANARLIAAAPELLEALLNIVLEIVPADPNCQLWLDAQAAIFKATGKQL